MLTCQIKIKENKKDIIKQIEKSMPNAIEKVLKYGQDIALENKRGSKDKENVLYEITIDKNGVSGRLYTNFDYALFLEYGTGTLAELPHIGHTETFKASGYTYWFLPKEVADAKGKSFNSNRLINIKGELFYIMFPTQPFPFMRPTAFELENKAINIFVKALKDGLRKWLDGRN